MEERETLELQERELNRLCDAGFHFTVERKVRRRKKGLCRFFCKPVVEKETMQFDVLQPTLNTIDRIAPHMVRFQDYANRVKDAEDAELLEAAKSTVIEARNMAKFLSIMVLGEDYYVWDADKGRYDRDDAELKRLEEIMYHHIKPARLFSLCEACLAVCNLADFMNSIRLLAAETEAANPRKSRVD